MLLIVFAFVTMISVSISVPKPSYPNHLERERDYNFQESCADKASPAGCRYHMYKLPFGKYISIYQSSNLGGEDRKKWRGL